MDEFALLGGHRGFFRKHDGNIVADGVDAAASLAFQTGLVRRQLNRRLAHWAYEDIEQVLRNGHLASLLDCYCRAVVRTLSKRSRAGKREARSLREPTYTDRALN